MELREFIAATINDIIGGVQDAQEANKSNGAVINPAIKDSGQSRERIELTTIKFKVGLTDSLSTEGRKGIGVAWSLISAGGSKEKSATSEAITNIEFDINVILPSETYIKKKIKAHLQKRGFSQRFYIPCT